MSLRHGLLGLLNYGPMTGYDLDKVFKDSLNFFWQAQTSQIYRELNAMEKSGWLTFKMEIQTGKPNKKLYSLTEAGRQELMDWLVKDTIDDALQIRSQFLLKLFFLGERSAEESIAMLSALRLECAEGLNNLENATYNIEKYNETINDDKKAIYWGLTAQFGKAYVNMCLNFADEAIKALEKTL